MSPLLIEHRRNTIEALRDTDPAHGVEVDLRMHGDRLVVAHDPGEDGVDFEAWLQHYAHRFLIADIKGEGVERLALPLLAERGVEDFFLLNLTTPSQWSLAEAGERRTAVRVSELERVQTAIALQGLCRWAWVDGFFGFPLGALDARRLRQAGYRICVVSPELQGHGADAIEDWAEAARRVGLGIDAVCTRHASRWRKTQNF